MAMAAQHYLGGKVPRVWVWGPPLLAGVIHWWVFEHFAARIVVINLTLGLQMAGLGALLLHSRAGSPGRWRWLAAAALLASAPLVLARAALVIWAPAEYPSFESPHWLNVAGLMVNSACLGVGTLAFLMAHRDEAEAQLARLATQDPLTGLLNRRALMEQGERLVQLARRHGAPLTVMMFDIDHFKRINDERGHLVGDRVIAHFAAALHSTLREGDAVGRYGGEEFVAVLYGGGLDTAASVDARLRAWLGQTEAALGVPVNYSAGAAGLGADGGSLESVIARADEALYRAKQGGRGRLVLSDGR
jgi:diguanylate cyclase (GGDEF)-like protein